MTRSTNGPLADASRTIANRRRFLLAIWLVAGVGILLQAANRQVLQASDWRRAADRQHQTRADVPAARGAILDRNEVELAASHETFQVGVDPDQLVNPDEVAVLLEDALSLSSSEAKRITDSDREWVSIAGRFPPSVRETLGGVRGVYLQRELRRFYPHEGLGRGLLGAVIDGLGAGGVEQEFDEHLQGEPGSEMLARDSRGRTIPGETWMIDAPSPGGSVVLSLDAALQEIAGEVLADAVGSTGARGGDLIVTNPHTGEILAMVSVRDGASTHLGGINTPYEPGSTFKPFTVATLLREGKASLSDSIDAGNGTWTTHGRTLSDVSAVGTVTLARALQVSSNVGVAKAASNLTPEEQYEALRDFGFGVSTGIALPGEASGTLRRPDAWSAQSPASLAIGYEVAVTPIQMAMAYGALANGGVLMEPLLIREERDADGRTVERFDPRPVRRVIPERIANDINLTLVEAVETGTGTQAQLASFAVAGKSGTSRAVSESGRYESGAYFASFVGFFPAENPQLVVYVKLERPQGTYYGGATAAPVTRATMEAILAAPERILDRTVISAIAQAQRGASPDADVADALLSDGAGSTSASSPLFTTVSTEDVLAEADPTPDADGVFTMPDLRGASARSAVRRMHALGLAVMWESSGPIARTIPAAGTPLVQGDTIQLVTTYRELDPASTTIRRADE